MFREVQRGGQWPDFQFAGESSVELKESADEIKERCREVQDFWGKAPEVKKIIISPSAESGRSRCRIEGDIAHLELETPDSAGHEYAHALVGPLCEKSSDSLSTEASQQIFDSLADEVRRKHAGEDESPAEIAPRLLEEYLVRAGDTYLRVNDEGGEAAVLAEANRRLTEAGGDKIETFQQLLEQDKDWQLRAFFYEQLQEFQRLKESGEINSIEEFLPEIIKKLEEKQND